MDNNNIRTDHVMSATNYQTTQTGSEHHATTQKSFHAVSAQGCSIWGEQAMTVTNF